MTMIYNINLIEAETIKKAVNIALPFEKVIITECFEDAWQAASSGDFDMFIISLLGDLSVSGRVTGIELIRKLRKYEPYKYTDIVLTSDHNDAACFVNHGVYCAGMLCSPVDINEASDLFKFLAGRRKNFMKKRINKDGLIVYKKYNRTEFLFAGNIIFTEKSKRSFMIHTAGKSITMDRRRADKLIEKLDKYGFIQVSRNEYVNPDYIVGFSYNEIILEGLDYSVHVTPLGIENLNSAFNIHSL